MSDDDVKTPGSPDDGRPALMCVDDGDRRRAVRAALQQLGYDPETPGDAAEAIDQLRKVAYQVVVVDETYGGGGALDNPVLTALSSMAMAVRRYMFVLLIAADVKSFDNATAFARSVNAVVDPNDLAQLAPALRRAIIDNDAFYRVFREVLQAAGKR
jgi:DNA-binding NtrC family response regulator